MHPHFFPNEKLHQRPTEGTQRTFVGDPIGTPDVPFTSVARGRRGRIAGAHGLCDLLRARRLRLGLLGAIRVFPKALEYVDQTQACTGLGLLRRAGVDLNGSRPDAHCPRSDLPHTLGDRRDLSDAGIFLELYSAGETMEVDVVDTVCIRPWFLHAPSADTPRIPWPSPSPME
jgi:hypothetical protein